MMDCISKDTNVRVYVYVCVYVIRFFIYKRQPSYTHIHTRHTHTHNNMRRILQRHGIHHANTMEHIESIAEDGPLHCMITALSHCLRIWFSPGESFYIPASSTNWGLQTGGVDGCIDTELLTIKRIGFMNAGRYLQDASGKTLGTHRRALINKLAFHARSYAAALYDAILKQPSISQIHSHHHHHHHQHPAEDSCHHHHPLSLLTFHWTRTSTTHWVREYSTQSAIDECVLAWSTAIAAQLTLGQYTEASTSVHILTSILMKSTSAVTPATHHVNAFSPPIMDLPCALVVTVRDALALLRDVNDNASDQHHHRHHIPVAKALIECFARGGGLRCLPPHVKKLTDHCGRILRDCEAFLRIRQLLCDVRDRMKCHHYHHQLDDGSIITDAYDALQENGGIEGRADFVVTEMAKLDIAIFAARRKRGS